MKKKTIVAVLAALVIGGAMLSGCGSSDTSVDKEIVNNKDDKKKEEPKEVTIEEQVLMDANGIKITAKGLEDGLFGTDLKLLIENNTDTNLTVQANASSVNGFMVDTLMSEDVAAGKKSNTTLTFSTTGLKDGNITTIANMEFIFHIFNTDTWDAYYDSEMILVETSAAEGYVQSFDDSGTEFYNADGIRIIGKGLSSEDSFFGPGLIVYIENDTDQNITVQARDTSVNGFMIDANMSQDVVAGKKALTAVTFFSTSLEENEIENIESVETSFHIFNMDTWDNITDTEAIVIDFAE